MNNEVEEEYKAFQDDINRSNPADTAAAKFYEKRYRGVGAAGGGGGGGDDQSEVAAGRGGAQRRATRQTPTHPSERDTPPHFRRGDRGCVLVGRSLWHAGYPAN